MNKKGRLIAKIVLSVSAFLAICFYVLDLIIVHSSPFKYLWIVLSIAAVCVIIVIKLFVDEYKEMLNSMEEAYAKDIVGAFDWDERSRKKLLRAIYYFTQNKNKKSIDALLSLEKKCCKTNDYKAVLLFIALNYTNSGQDIHAILYYEKAIKNGYASSNIYNNIGHLYAKSQDNLQAHKNYDLAIYYDNLNLAAYHNKAQLCFKENNFKMALELSEKALQINPTYRPSSTLVAIIYALEGRTDEAIEAKGRAIENGESPASIERSILYYKKQNKS